MRIKSDFITNSSSASFLIAIKNGTTKEALREIFRESAQRFMRDFSYEDYDYMFSDEGISEEDYNEEEILNFLANKMLGEVKDGLSLGDWKAISREYGNESAMLFDNFIYGYLYGIENHDEIIKYDSYM